MSSGKSTWTWLLKLDKATTCSDMVAPSQSTCQMEAKKKSWTGASKRVGKTSIFLNRKLYGVEQGNLDWRIVPEDYKRNIVSIQSKSMENLQWS